MKKQINKRVVNRDSHDKYHNVRHVTLMKSQSRYGEDLYKMRETGAVLIRRNIGEGLVRWSTATKSQYLYEAAGPMKDGITIVVLDSNSKVLFKEDIFTTERAQHGVAIKMYPFSWEGR